MFERETRSRSASQLSEILLLGDMRQECCHPTESPLRDGTVSQTPQQKQKQICSRVPQGAGDKLQLLCILLCLIEDNGIRGSVHHMHTGRQVGEQGYLVMDMGLTQPFALRAQVRQADVQQSERQMGKHRNRAMQSLADISFLLFDSFIMLIHSRGLWDSSMLRSLYIVTIFAALSS